MAVRCGHVSYMCSKAVTLQVAAIPKVAEARAFTKNSIIHLNTSGTEGIALHLVVAASRLVRSSG